MGEDLGIIDQNHELGNYAKKRAEELAKKIANAHTKIKDYQKAYDRLLEYRQELDRRQQEALAQGRAEAAEDLRQQRLENARLTARLEEAQRNAEQERVEESEEESSEDVEERLAGAMDH